MRHQPVSSRVADGGRGRRSPARRSSSSSRRVLGPANRKAEAIKYVMRGESLETFDVLNRRWVMGSDGDIYHYNYFDPRQRHFTGLWIYEFNADMTRLTRRTFAQRAAFVNDATWQAEARLDARVRRHRRPGVTSFRSSRRRKVVRAGSRSSPPSRRIPTS